MAASLSHIPTNDRTVPEHPTTIGSNGRHNIDAAQHLHPHTPQWRTVVKVTWHKCTWNVSASIPIRQQLSEAQSPVIDTNSMYFYVYLYCWFFLCILRLWKFSTLCKLFVALLLVLANIWSPNLYKKWTFFLSVIVYSLWYLCDFR